MLGQATGPDLDEPLEQALHHILACDEGGEEILVIQDGGVVDSDIQ